MIHSPGHPGAVLSEELDVLGITVTQASEDLGISRQLLSAILNERRPITADMAVRIGHYINNGPGIWARMQTNYNLWQAEQKMKSVLKCTSVAPASAQTAATVAGASVLTAVARSRFVSQPSTSV